jgi:hypothetical protein
MAEVISTGFFGNVLEIYNSFISTLPTWAQNFIVLFLLVFLVVIYSIFIWKLHKFIARKNILELNLKKYSQVEHPYIAKLLVGAFYFLEYIIISPFVIFFWFAVFTLFLIVLTESIEIKSLLIISATIVASIRMTAYYKEDLSREFAKLLPFTLLATSLLEPDFFNVQRIFTSLSSMPNFWGDIIYYLGFIITLEVALRFFEFIFSFFDIEEIPEED